MFGRTHRLVLTALLGVALVLGGSLSAAQAATMSMNMPMAEMADGMAQHHNCGDCSGGMTDNAAKMNACAQACAPALAAVLPAEISVAQSETAVPTTFGRVAEWDWAPAPNPSPPRS